MGPYGSIWAHGMAAVLLLSALPTTALRTGAPSRDEYIKYREHTKPIKPIKRCVCVYMIWRYIRKQRMECAEMHIWRFHCCKSENLSLLNYIELTLNFNLFIFSPYGSIWAHGMQSAVRRASALRTGAPSRDEYIKSRKNPEAHQICKKDVCVCVYMIWR